MPMSPCFSDRLPSSATSSLLRIGADSPQRHALVLCAAQLLVMSDRQGNSPVVCMYLVVCSARVASLLRRLEVVGCLDVCPVPAQSASSSVAGNALHAQTLALLQEVELLELSLGLL